mgnify:FL=1
MNMTITESDKRLLSFLTAVLLLLLLVFLVLRPLADKNSDLKRQITAAKDQEVVMDLGAALAGDAEKVEEETGEQLEETLKRYYQNLQSQDAEKMVTTLLLNHRMQIKNLTVTMPDTKSDLKWYQYSEKAATEIAGEEKIEGQTGIYAVRVLGGAEGSRADMLALLTDISENYPAISIAAVEWLENTGSLTLTLEIYMCK